MSIKRKTTAATDIASKHYKQLIAISLLTKVLIVIMTVYLLNSFIDTYAIAYYFEKAINIFNGQIPYLSYTYEYPVLALIPSFIALVPAIIYTSIGIYILSFISVMIICDLITTICVYNVALTVWGNNRQAFIAAFLYATAVQVAYVTISEFSAFATMLMMVGITYTVCNKDKVKGYISTVLGFFTKVFPIIALPFIILYNTKRTSLKTEMISAGKILGIATAILFVPLYLINPANIETYLFRINGGDRGFYASAFLYTVYSWIHDVFHIGITTDLLSNVSKVIMVISITGLLLIAYKVKTMDPALLLKLIVSAIFIVVACMQFHSPNYDTWAAPLVCILAATDIRKIGLFVLSQIIAYIVFPLSFYSVWTNPGYTGTIGSTGWYIALLLFTIQFIVLIVLMWLIVEPEKVYRQLRESW